MDPVEVIQYLISLWVSAIIQIVLREKNKKSENRKMMKKNQSEPGKYNYIKTHIDLR